jgi:hypothetical protein
MSSNTRNIAVRGWIAIAATFAAVAVSMALDRMEGFREPYRPPDRTLAARISLVSSWMLPVGLILGPAALFRARNGAFFEGGGKGGRILPLSCGVCGLALFVTQWVRWGPYTGEDFAMSQGWQFGVAWFLVWWCLLFVRIGAEGGDSGFVDSKRDQEHR